MKNQFNPNKKLINKYNKLLDEAMEYYNIKHALDTAMRENKTIYYIDVFQLGYTEAVMASNGGFNTRFGFIQKNYPLLAPFYMFARFLLQNSIPEDVSVTNYTLTEINNSIHKMRKNTFYSPGGESLYRV